jgi:GAF domain-containing protein
MAEALPLNPSPGAGPSFPPAILDSLGMRAFISDWAVEFLKDSAGQARGFDWAITLFSSGIMLPWMSGSAKAEQIDDLHRQFADSPASAAATSGEFVHLPDIAVDRRWPGFSAAVAAQGTGSLLSVPITVSEHATAVLTLYAPCPHAFTSADLTAAVAFTRRISKVCALLMELAAGKAGRAATRDNVLSVFELAVQTLVREFGLTAESALHYLKAMGGDTTAMPSAQVAATGTTALPGSPGYGHANALLHPRAPYPQTG